MGRNTQQAVKAFFEGVPKKLGNTEVLVYRDTATMFLHDNVIARKDGDTIWVCDADSPTTATKEHLNGILAYLGIGKIYQRAGLWRWKGDLFPRNSMVILK